MERTPVNCTIGKDTVIWYYTNLFDSKIGDNCMIGSYVEIGGATIGNNVSIQSGCFIPRGTVIEDNVFLGPHTVILNDKRPPSKGKHWEPVVIKKGAVVGGGSKILPGVVVGENTVVGAGTVLTKSVPDNVTVYTKLQGVLINNK